MGLQTRGHSEEVVDPPDLAGLASDPERGCWPFVGARRQCRSGDSRYVIHPTDMTDLGTHNKRSNSGTKPPPQNVAETAIDPLAQAWGSVAFCGAARALCPAGTVASST